jgi:hypothetical protein
MAGHGAGQDGIGLGGVLGGQDAGLVFDDPQVYWVDLAGAQRGECRREPPSDVSGEAGQGQLLGRGGEK